ncbi:hypothetical protein QTP88_017871 [Uroleucon formosanum]
MKRGESMEYVTSYEKAPISAVIWKDNKAVKLVSTYCGETPKTKVTRFDRSKKKEIEIDCPKLVTEYNHNMGGVDLLDSHIGRAKKQKNEENEIMELAEWRKILVHSLIKSGEVRHSGKEAFNIN